MKITGKYVKKNVYVTPFNMDQWKLTQMEFDFVDSGSVKHLVNKNLFTSCV